MYMDGLEVEGKGVRLYRLKDGDLIIIHVIIASGVAQDLTSSSTFSLYRC